MSQTMFWASAAAELCGRIPANTYVISFMLSLFESIVLPGLQFAVVLRAMCQWLGISFCCLFAGVGISVCHVIMTRYYEY